VRRVAHVAVTPEDGDRVMGALANLLELARATGSPAIDVQEIEGWRVEAERRVEALRVRRPTVQVQADIARRRVSA
jgi:hypothetical protein